MAVVRGTAPSALLLCLLLGAMAVLWDDLHATLAGRASEPIVSPVCQTVAGSTASEPSSWIDPPLRLSSYRQRREATATSDEPAED
jgi:hypothetical protein